MLQCWLAEDVAELLVIFYGLSNMFGYRLVYDVTVLAVTLLPEISSFLALSTLPGQKVCVTAWRYAGMNIA